jgi:glucuronosyltransferase
VNVSLLNHFHKKEMTEVLHAGAHCEEANELPEEYRTFVEDPKSKGTIYVAFGTIVPWDYAPPRVVKAFFDAFERLSDYRIIFSFNGKFPDRKLSSHIRLVKWAPQSAILSHSKTKIFLTHCGLKR